LERDRKRLISTEVSVPSFNLWESASRSVLDCSMEAPMNTNTATRSDLDALTALNRDYIHSVQFGDVQRFGEILAEDFLCSNPDGSLVDKEQFLAQTARPVTISGLSVEDVRVRILGDVGIIHARTSYTTPSGEQRNGRYTDVWARRDGKWLAVSAL
jgi:ketosteroid isomerase-like protein